MDSAPVTDAQTGAGASATPAGPSTGNGGITSLASIWRAARLLTSPSPTRWSLMLARLRCEPSSESPGQHPEVVRRAALEELCNLLTIGSDDTMQGLSIDDFIPILVRMLEPSTRSHCERGKGSELGANASAAEQQNGFPVSANDMLLACTALTLLIDCQPLAASVSVRCKVVPFLCDHLLTIQYIDLAEQCIQAVRRIARTHPKVILREGGLHAVLFHLDFFPINMQRQAIETAALLCRKVSTDSQTQAALDEALPVLTGLLGHSDSQVAASACMCFARLSESEIFSSRSSAWLRHRDAEAGFRRLAAHGLVRQLVALVSPKKDTHVSGDHQGRYAGVADVKGECIMQAFNLLTELCGLSPVLAAQAIDAGVVLVLSETLSLSEDCEAFIPTNHLSPKMLGVVLRLVNALLPPLSTPRAARLSPVTTVFVTKRSCDSDEQRCKMVEVVGQSVLKTCMHLVRAPPTQAVRHGSLVVVVKMLCGCEGNRDALYRLVFGVGIGHFVALLISARDGSLVFSGLEILDVLMGESTPPSSDSQCKDHSISLETSQTALFNDTPSSPKTNAGSPRSITRSMSFFRQELEREGVAHALAALAASSKSTVKDCKDNVYRPFSSEHWLQSSKLLLWLKKRGVAIGRENERKLRQSTQLQRQCATSARRALSTFFPKIASDLLSNGAHPEKVSSAGRPIALARARAQVHPILLVNDDDPVLDSPVAFGEKGDNFTTHTSGVGHSPLEPSGEILDHLSRIADNLQAECSLCASSPSLLNLGSEYELAHRSDAENLRSLSALLCGDRRITPFELLRSGLVQSLNAYLTVPAEILKRKDRIQYEKDVVIYVQRVRLVVSALLGIEHAGRRDHSKIASGPPDAAPMLALVEVLQASLDITQRMPVRIYGESDLNIPMTRKVCDTSIGTNRLSNQLRALSCPFALRLKYVSSAGRHGVRNVGQSPSANAVPGQQPQPNGRGLCNNQVVLVEPLAMVKSIADHIKLREQSRLTPANISGGASSDSLSPASNTPPLSGTLTSRAPDGPSSSITPGPNESVTDEAPATSSLQAARILSPSASAGTTATRNLSKQTYEHMSRSNAEEMPEVPRCKNEGKNVGDMGNSCRPETVRASGSNEGDVESGASSTARSMRVDGSMTSGPSLRPESGLASTTSRATSGSETNECETSVPPRESVTMKLDLDVDSHSVDSDFSSDTDSLGECTDGQHQDIFDEDRFGLSAHVSGHEIVFFFGKKVLLPSMSIFESICRFREETRVRNQPYSSLAIREDERRGDRDSERIQLVSALEEDATALWIPEYELTYKYCDVSEAKELYRNSRLRPVAHGGLSKFALKRERQRACRLRLVPEHQRWRFTTPRAMILMRRELGRTRALSFLPRDDPSSQVMQLLRLLASINRHWRSLISVMQGSRSPQFRASAVDELQASIEEARGAGAVSWSAFVNMKLNSKLRRQLKDPLALCPGALPKWCKPLVHHLPFLFDFEVRKQFLYTTAFGIGRGLQQLQHDADAQSASELGHRAAGRRFSTDTGFSGILRVGRMKRQKVRVSRDELLDAASQTLGMFATTSNLLEIEFFGEIGTGSGPTAEFYSAVSKELRKRKEHMWRDDGFVGNQHTQSAATSTEQMVEDKDDDTLLPTNGGLFPSVQSTRSTFIYRPQAVHLLRRFEMMGSLLARALMDQHLVDFPFSPPLLKLILGKRLHMFDLYQVDSDLARSLMGLCQIAQCRRNILFKVRANILQSTPNDDTSLISAEQEALQKGVQTGLLSYDGCEIKDLGLNFTLPARAILQTQGSKRELTLDNLEEYTELVAAAILHDGVRSQIEALRKGFLRVISLSCLRSFSAHEIDLLMCGSHEAWSTKALSESTRCDHGYTKSSRAILMLFEIMSAFSRNDQALFLSFVTGAPKLPSGGLRALTPPLTIVRRTTNRYGMLADDCLPSVMTCTHYLKLPDYSCKTVARRQILTAIREGCSAFHLS